MGILPTHPATPQAAGCPHPGPQASSRTPTGTPDAPCCRNSLLGPAMPPARDPGAPQGPSYPPVCPASSRHGKPHPSPGGLGTLSPEPPPRRSVFPVELGASCRLCWLLLENLCPHPAVAALSWLSLALPSTCPRPYLLQVPWKTSAEPGCGKQGPAWHSPGGWQVHAARGQTVCFQPWDPQAAGGLRLCRGRGQGQARLSFLELPLQKGGTGPRQASCPLELRR